MYRVFYVYEYRGKKYMAFATTDNYEPFMTNGFNIYYVTNMDGEIIIDNRKEYDEA